MADHDREQERDRWTKLVADYEAGDLTQREFAAERGTSIGASTNCAFGAELPRTPV
jgi:hypothetical protein